MKLLKISARNLSVFFGNTENDADNDLLHIFSSLCCLNFADKECEGKNLTKASFANFPPTIRVTVILLLFCYSYPNGEIKKGKKGGKIFDMNKKLDKSIMRIFPPKGDE